MKRMLNKSLKKLKNVQGPVQFEWNRLPGGLSLSYADLARVFAELQQPKFATIWLIVGGSDQFGQSWLLERDFKAELNE